MLNPVLRREIITVMRTWRTFIFIAAYTLLLAVVALIAIFSISGNAYSGFNPKDTVSMGITLTVFQLALVLLFVPAISAGAISGERERQTLDLMLVTKIPTLSIVIGKLMSSILVVVLMIAASLPVYGVVMYFDSVSIIDLLLNTLFTILTAAMVGSISILMSSLFKKTIMAVIATYLLMIILFLGVLLVAVTFNSLFSAWNWFPRLSYNTIFVLLCGNPILGLVSIFDSQLGYDSIQSLVSSAGYGYVYYSSALTVPVLPVIPLWVFNMLFDGIVVVICGILSSVMIKPTGMGKKRS